LNRKVKSRGRTTGLLLPLRKEFMLARFHFRKRKERIQQIAKARTVVSPGTRTTHIIAVRKKAYLKAAIRCANSIWYKSPEMQIVIHIDRHLANYSDYLIGRLDRKDRARLQLEESFNSWQELKLRVILHDLGENDSFSDADLYWNVPIPLSNSGYYFAAENSLLNREPYSKIIQDCKIQLHPDSFMANSSFVALGKFPSKSEFVDEVESNFVKVRNQLAIGTYDEAVRSKVLRLSEQIVLSISINKHSNHFKTLKLTDDPMDGGPAESYYLGTTKGWA
jgi:hypothetical protein